MIKGRASLNDPNGIEMSVTITMTVAEWKKIRAQLRSEWPSWCLESVLGRLLDSLVDRVETAQEVER